MEQGEGSKNEGGKMEEKGSLYNYRVAFKMGLINTVHLAKVGKQNQFVFLGAEAPSAHELSCLYHLLSEQ